MPGIDLSTLSAPELRRLRKLAHARNDGPLADQLEWEIASRSAGGRRVAAPLPPVESRDEPPIEEPPSLMRWPDPEPLEPVRDAADTESARGGMLLVALGLVGGSLITAAAFWVGGFNSPRDQHQIATASANVLAARRTPPAARAANEAAPIEAEPARGAPVQAPIASGEAIGTEPPDPALQPGSDRDAIAVAAERQGIPAASTEKTPEPPHRPRATADEARSSPTRLAKAETRAAASSSYDECRRASTPADRLVCKDLGLQMLDLQLREAFARALNARADPVVLGPGQTAWRRARDEVSDPQRLAHLYDRRIRELNEAADAAGDDQQD